jgi:hypothetical protein
MGSIQELSPESQNVCKILHTHFNALRQKQKQSIELSSITDDIRFLLKFVLDSVKEPVMVLRIFGIIITRQFVAFNLNSLQTHLCFASKGRVATALRRDGWKEADDTLKQQLFPLIGENEAKNWTALRFPEDAVAKDFMDMRLIATETNIRRSMRDPRPLPMAYMPVPQNTGFPLVAVRYERVYKDFEVADFKPLEDALLGRKLDMFHAEPLNLRIPD